MSGRTKISGGPDSPRTVRIHWRHRQNTHDYLQKKRKIGFTQNYSSETNQFFKKLNCETRMDMYKISCYGQLRKGTHEEIIKFKHEEIIKFNGFWLDSTLLRSVMITVKILIRSEFPRKITIPIPPLKYL